jgi:septal ring-binding cell division protein DamX
MTDERTNEQKVQTGKFTEDEIKRKLYGAELPGQLKPSLTGKKPAAGKHAVPAEPREKPAVAERSHHHAVLPQAKLADAVTESAAQEVLRHTQQELAVFKEKVARLEKQLRQAEEQNDRLKKKLSPKHHGGTPMPQEGQPGQLLAPDIAALIVPAVIVLIILFGVILVGGRIGRRPAREQQQPPRPLVPAERTTASTLPVPSERQAVSVPAPGQKQYTIQVMEFALEEAANRFVDQLKQEGYDVFVQRIYRADDRTKPYFKVSVGLFSTMDEAKRFNETFQQKKGITDSFIREWRQ